jgi:hypothetical protein
VLQNSKIETDEDGNEKEIKNDVETLTLNGLLAVETLQTQSIVITGEEKGATIGENAIAEGAYDVFVPTVAVVNDSRIFVTPKGGVVSQTLSISRIDEHSGFHVTVSETVDKTLKFDWLIVEDQIEKEKKNDKKNRQEEELKISDDDNTVSEDDS